MSKIALFILIISLIALNIACSKTETTNTNTSSNVKPIDDANLPEGFSDKPISPSGNSTPGIPDANNINIKPNPNGTPTPGIQDPAKATPFPKGATTPGIPANINSASSMTDSDKTPQPKTNRRP